MCAMLTGIHLFSLEANGILSVYGMSSAYALVIELAITFFYCLISEALTVDLYEIGDVFYELAWYQLPIKQQTLIMPALQLSQQECHLKGIGMVECSLNVFGKVNWTIIQRLYYKMCHFFSLSLIFSDSPKCWLVLFVYSQIQMKSRKAEPLEAPRMIFCS